jgi:hypothetical protein
MRDPWNPTAEEIREWATEPNAICEQDWDLGIIGIGHEALFMELVEDENCPNADFFLHCLYLWAYETVLAGAPMEELKNLLQRGEASREPALRLWAKRCRRLIADPASAERELWCGFGQSKSDT